VIETRIIFFGQRVILSCDGDCAHAWGVNWHGKKGDAAPDDTGWYEGGHPKPTDRVHNKWCARECERSKMRDDDTDQAQEGI
jgi:hypothetical protein